MNTQQLAEYLETYGPKSNIDRTALLAAAELRRLHEENERLKAQQQEQQALEEQLGDALNSFVFYRRRVEALQQWQSKMRDPERTIVCDIIANGCALEPAGDRYKQPAQQQEPVAFIRSDRHGDVALEWDKDEDLEGGLYSYEPLYTSPQPAQQQEPVAYRFKKHGSGNVFWYETTRPKNPEAFDIEPLYISLENNNDLF